MSERVDRDAERGLIGVLLNRPAEVADLDRLTADDFWDPQCRYLFEVLQRVVAVARGGPVEMPAVLGQVKADGKLGQFENGARLIDWYREAFPGSVGFYVEKIREASALRRFSILGQRLQQASEDGADLDAVRDVAAQVMVELYVAADDSLITGDAPVPGLTTWERFVDDPGRHRFDWVIPGLLERHDRVMVVAGEGAGKSTWGRQMALMAAAGLHPLAPDQAIPPVRTLLVDLENSPSLVRRQGAHLIDRCRELGIWQDGLAHVWCQPDGIDIRQGPDARLFERVVRETNPQLLVVGPLYKLASTGKRGETYEAVAEEVRTELDRLRGKYGFALWLEHHLPKAQSGQPRSMDPLGSGVWMRWPEFGIALRREWTKPGKGVAPQPTGRVFLERFRPDREEGRTWPDSLVRGSTWPWRAEWSDQEIADMADPSWAVNR